MKLKVSSKAILCCDGKVLIVSDGGIWDFPGGGIENDETLDVALARELHEELGLKDVTLPGKLVHVDEWFIRKPGKETHVVGVFYQVELPGKHQPTLSDEHDNFAWIAPEELSNYNATADTVRALKAAKV